MKAKRIVVDTAAFVKYVPLWDMAEELYSLPEVVEEIRDKPTRQRIEAYPVPINMRQPQPHHISFINEFSKKTGDSASLSLADIKVLALAYELEFESKGNTDHLRKEPQQITTEYSKPRKIEVDTETKTEGFYMPSEQEDDESGDHKVPGDDCLAENIQDFVITEETEDQGFEDSSNIEIEDEDNEENEDIDDEDDDEVDIDENDDDDGWITPSNVAKHKKKKKMGEMDVTDELEEVHDVACITADYAMQNVLKHIGIKVMGVDGKLIQQLRTYILRCHACYKTTSMMDKVFCPKCGNKTLKKVSVTLNSDGTQHIWINTKRAINTKGMKYSLPRPRGGKHAVNPILVADQREAQQLASKLGRKKTNPLHEDYDTGDSPFAVRDVYSRAAQLGYVGGKKQHNYHWEQRNPNEAKKRIHKKK